ncbi:MAG: Putative two-component response regulator [uncultured Sulfurovum sp.]|uniref:Two-component response regulator n=1 Tax=uncultured Sulfurovum sp. TaxID=269237 RepID=A0A6S6U623_9BACT|nr:MAG: Putative two-component response regulator [uncultured Sulfurovum sp.]
MYKFLKDKTLLYIEDEKSIRDNVTELLSDYFGSFYAASSAEEGYEIFKNKQIHIIITDIEMGNMNGLELLEKIREEDSKIHLVVVSAHTKIEYLLEAIPFKLEQYVVKPLNSKKIRELLSTLNDAFSDSNRIILSPTVVLDKERSIIDVEGEERALTTKENAILTILADKKVISYDEIEFLWGEEIASDNAIRSCIKKLRKKLPDKLLKTRSGLGYYIE